MLRWLLILVLIAAVPLGGFMTWRTLALTTPQPKVIVALPPGSSIKIDEAAAVKHLAQAIKFKTIAGDDGKPLDPDEFLHFEQWIASTYPAIGAAATVERIADYSLLYTWAGADPSAQPILLIAHLDVTTPGGNADFSGAVKGDAIWGRGAQIGKSPLVAILEAANALAASGFKPKRTIIIALGHDGDVRGEAGAAQIARVLKARKVNAWFALDEGSPALANNALTGKPSVLIGVSEKRDLDLLVTATAPAGAAAVSGPQAVTMMAQALVALGAMPNRASLGDEPTASMMRALGSDMPFSRAFVLANAWLFEPLILMQMQGTPGGEDLISTTVAPTVLQGGGNQTLRPSEARATLNVRLHPSDTPQAFLARARMVAAAFPGVTLDWETLPDAQVPIASDHSDAFRVLATIASNSADHATVAPSLYIGSTDARHYTALAGDVYRYTPALWTDADIRNVMGPNEHLTLRNFGRMIGFYESLMSEAAG